MCSKVYRHSLGAGAAQWRLAQYPHSSPLTREEGRRNKERERETYSNASFDFVCILVLRTLSPWTSSNIVELRLLNSFQFYTEIKQEISGQVSPVKMWGNISNQNPRALIFGWHGSWNRVLSVSKPILLHGFSTRRTRRKLQVLAAGLG